MKLKDMKYAEGWIVSIYDTDNGVWVDTDKQGKKCSKDDLEVYSNHYHASTALINFEYDNPSNIYRIDQI